MIRWVKRWPLMALPIGLVACLRASPADPEAPALRVEYAGCRTVRAGPVCELPADGRLRLWVRTDPRADVEIQPRPSGAAPVVIEGGSRYVLEVAPGDGKVQVRASGGDATASWHLELHAAAPHAVVAEADRLRRAGEPDEAARVLREALPDAGPAYRGILLGRLARLSLHAGKIEASIGTFREAIGLHRLCGQVYEEIDDATALTHTLLYHGRRFAEARSTLAGVARKLPGCGEAGFFLAYYQGLLALNTGDLRTALARLDDAARQARRAGLDGYARAAGQVHARLLQKVGNRAEASARLERLLETVPADTDDCRRAQLMNNLAWSRLLELEAGETGEAPVRLLTDARDRFERGCDRFKDERVNVRINLALAHLHAGEPDRALASLDEARAVQPGANPRFDLWELDIRGRIAQAHGNPREAARSFLRLERLAAQVLDPEAEWRAITGRAEALAAQGKDAEAIMALERAEELTGRALVRVAVGDGRAGYLAARGRATGLRIRLLMGQGRAEEAFDVFRQARIRALQTLARGYHERHLGPGARRDLDAALTAYRTGRESFEAAVAEDWRLPADQLDAALQARDVERQRLARLLDRAIGRRDPAPTGVSRPGPAEGEVILGYVSIAGSWVGFAQGPGGVTARKLGQLSPEMTPAELASHLLAPFSDVLAGSRRVRILASGWVESVDFQALPFSGKALLASREVTFGLDLAAPPARNREAGGSKALVVVDPAGDLPMARAELRSILPDLGGPAGSVVTLVGREASAARVGRMLASADRVHFAGHGLHAGHGGWGSALRLAGDTSITAGDILALPRAPGTVVLLGCETGQTQPSPIAGLGLAQAFVVAGSREVVASVRPLHDRMAARVAALLYTGGKTDTDLASALRRTQLALREEHPDWDWASLRVFVP